MKSRLQQFTGQTRACAELKQKQRQVEAAPDGTGLQMTGLIEQAGDGIAVYEFTSSASSRFTGANPALCALLGYTGNEMRNLSPRDIVATEDSAVLADNTRALQTTGSLRHEKTLVAKDGRKIPVEITARLFQQRDRLMVLSVIRDISGRKAMEAALRKSEDGYRNLVESSPDAIFVHYEGRYVYANQAAARLFRVKDRSQLIGASVLESVHPFSRDFTQDRVRQVARTGKATPAGEVKMLCLDGTMMEVEATWSPVMYQGLQAVQVVMHDVAARRQAEREREMAIQFLHLVNGSADTADLIEKALFFFQEQSGCEAVGIRLKQGDDYPYYLAKGFGAEFLQVENNLCLQDLAGNVLRDRFGEPVIACMCGNVIRGRFDRSRSFFTETGSFWTNCTTALLAGTTEDDRQGRTRNRCNKDGYESVALLPLHVGSQRLGLLQLNDRRKGVFSPDLIGMWERLTNHLAVALSKFVAEEELRCAHEELEQRVTERTAELAKALKDLHEKEHMLLQQSRLAAMGEMINNIAHQWRQPLNSLGLNVQQLGLSYGTARFNQELLDKAVDSSMSLIQHMSQTIDDFRNFFKTEKERVQFRASLVIVNAISLISGSFNHHQITIDVECDEDPLIYGYQNEYSQVLLNILMNSRDALKTRPEANRRVLISTRLRNNRSIMTISDNAGGIPANIMERIFDPYFTTKGPNGTGIGLFMAKNIIETNMHGSLHVHNTGDGAEFVIEV